MMSTSTALGIILAAGAAGVVMLLAGVGAIACLRGTLPNRTETVMIIIAVAVVMLAAVMPLWPDVPADPVLVTPTTYGPPPDPLAGYDHSELP